MSAPRLTRNFLAQFDKYALLITAAWLAAVAIRFRRSTPVLVGGIVAISAYAAIAVLSGLIPLGRLGIRGPTAFTLALVAVWLALMLAYSPLADWIASRLIDAPPTLGAFRALKESRAKLVAGIVVAWILGGFLEELVFRGVVLRAIATILSVSLAPAAATAIAVCAAAGGAGIVHLYQGNRAALIITQLSILFGILFVVSGYNLWAVVLCHGAYDTIAFVRFASGKSRYSRFAAES